MVREVILTFNTIFDDNSIKIRKFGKIIINDFWGKFGDLQFTGILKPIVKKNKFKFHRLSRKLKICLEISGN